MLELVSTSAYHIFYLIFNHLLSLYHFDEWLPQLCREPGTQLH